MSALLQELARALPRAVASEDDADRVAYARDLWPRHHLAVRAGHPAEHRPRAVVWPTSTDDVADLVRWSRARGVALAPFGAGSGVCGGVLPREDLVVVDLKRLARVRAIDVQAPSVEVEGGHMGVPLERALERAGFTLGHFPSSILCSTVGGWVATRSAGQCSGAYGKIEDMVAEVECVTGAGDVVRLHRRSRGPDLVPLVVGSEGTMAVVTSVRLRLHPAPKARAFGAWSLPGTEQGIGMMRAMFQSGLRPAVARLYDPLDSFMARRGRSGRTGSTQSAPGLGGVALRALLQRPGLLGRVARSRAFAGAVGALLLVIFEGEEDTTRAGLEGAARCAASFGGRSEGEEPARAWLSHRYAVSYRQAPLFAAGGFVDTMEVAAPWSSVEGTYRAVTAALGSDAVVTAHFSHAYPDGCCVYFTFAGAAGAGEARALGWDAACERRYDGAWRKALDAALGAGATLAHHHGVGRSKAPRLAAESGAGVDVVRALLRAFDPSGVLNPGNLIGPTRGARRSPAAPAEEPIRIDRESLLCSAGGGVDCAAAERALQEEGLTLDASIPGPMSVRDWLAAGAPGSRDRWLDPADQLVSGLDARLGGGHSFSLRPAPRRSVGPDLSALVVGAGERFGTIDRAWLRVHRRGVPRFSAPTFTFPRDPPISEGEARLLDQIAKELG